jgi:hypothetical protein
MLRSDTGIRSHRNRLEGRGFISNSRLLRLAAMAAAHRLVGVALDLCAGPIVTLLTSHGPYSLVPEPTFAQIGQCALLRLALLVTITLAQQQPGGGSRLGTVSMNVPYRSMLQPI